MSVTLAFIIGVLTGVLLLELGIIANFVFNNVMG